MVLALHSLSQRDRDTYWYVRTFFDGRLEESKSVDWAIENAGARNPAARAAITDALWLAGSNKLADPWRSVWHLILESWNDEAVEDDHDVGLHDLQQRISSGDRSGALIDAIADYFRPFLVVETTARLKALYGKSKGSGHAVSDLVYVRLSSRGRFDPQLLKLDHVNERNFVAELTERVEGTLNRALRISQRVNPSTDALSFVWPAGQVNRVYYVPAQERDLDDGQSEPDDYHRGISASVKLLHALASRLVILAPEYVKCGLLPVWRCSEFPIYRRLWAALGFDHETVSAEAVGEFLLHASELEFYRTDRFPEIAELRARRFGDLSSVDTTALVERLLKGPPAQLWGGKVAKAELKLRAKRWIATELSRIEVAGNILPDKAAGELVTLDGSQKVATVHQGLPGGSQVRWISTQPDTRLSKLDGTKLLARLEQAFSGKQDETSAADAWLRIQDNLERTITALEANKTAPSRHIETLTHVLNEMRVSADDKQANALVVRMLALLVSVPNATLAKVFSAAAYWANNHRTEISKHLEARDLWMRLWPIAAKDANKARAETEAPELEVFDSSETELDRRVAALNGPVADLMYLFRTFISGRTVASRPFDERWLRDMRDLTVHKGGRSAAIARSHLITDISWFLRTDKAWATHHLLDPLKGNDEQALLLWESIAGRAHRMGDGELRKLQKQIVDRATDQRLNRRTRERLINDVVVATLFAFYEGRRPPISHDEIQRVLRTVEDTFRTSVADIIVRFVRDNSTAKEGSPARYRAEDLFRKAVVPFLRSIWPRDAGLISSGVSGAFARLPIAAGGAFSQAVKETAPLAGPFQCWSLSDFGLSSRAIGERPGLPFIDTVPKAEALLMMLDRSIAYTEDAVVPRDLGEALSQVRRVHSSLATRTVYRRLAALARR